MPTVHQLIEPRPQRKEKTRVLQLQECPQKRGVCWKLFIMTPRKPNSAKRRVAKIKLSTKKFIFGYIPGEGNNLQKFSHVLIRGGLIRDLPGVHYTIIRGKLDLHSILYRRQGRSKYGTKIWWKPRKKERMAAESAYKKKILAQIFDFNYRRKSQKTRQLLKYACELGSFGWHLLYWYNTTDLKRIFLRNNFPYKSNRTYLQYLFKQIVRALYRKHKKTRTIPNKRLWVKKVLRSKLIQGLKKMPYIKPWVPRWKRNLDKKMRKASGFMENSNISQESTASSSNVKSSRVKDTSKESVNKKTKENSVNRTSKSTHTVQRRNEGVPPTKASHASEKQRITTQQRKKKVFPESWNPSQKTFPDAVKLSENINLRKEKGKIFFSTVGHGLFKKTPFRSKRCSKQFFVPPKTKQPLFFQLKASRREKRIFILKKRGCEQSFYYKKKFLIKNHKSGLCKRFSNKLVFQRQTRQPVLYPPKNNLRHSFLIEVVGRKINQQRTLQHQICPYWFLQTRLVVFSFWHKFVLKKRLRHLFDHNSLQSQLLRVYFSLKQKKILFTLNEQRRPTSLLDFFAPACIEYPVKFKGTKAGKKKIKRDPLFNQEYFAKFIQALFTQGRWVRGQEICDKMTRLWKQSTNGSFCFLVFYLVNKIKMSLELLPLRKSGRIIYIPAFVSFLRQFTQAVKLIKNSIFTRQELTILEKVYAELFDLVFNKQNNTAIKITKLYEVSFASQPNRHFRWRKNGF